jgi:hypothetical protein
VEGLTGVRVHGVAAFATDVASVVVVVVVVAEGELFPRRRSTVSASTSAGIEAFVAARAAGRPGRSSLKTLSG